MDAIFKEILDTVFYLHHSSLMWPLLSLVTSPDLHENIFWVIIRVYQSLDKYLSFGWNTGLETTLELKKKSFQRAVPKSWWFLFLERHEQSIYFAFGRKSYLKEELLGSCRLFLRIAMEVLSQAERKHRTQESDAPANPCVCFCPSRAFSLLE